MAAKSKSGSAETPTKVSPAAPRVSSKRSTLNSKLTNDRKSSESHSPSPLRSALHSADRSLRASLTSKLASDQRSAEAESSSPSPLRRTRHLDDRSTRSSLNPKPKIEWRSPKSATPSEKPQTRIGKGSELQDRLNSAQEDLKEVKERISSIDKEKSRAIDELKEANEKLREIESARNQHASDAATTQELERVKHELATACDAKNQALKRADEATKIAEIRAEKVEVLEAELVRFKSLIDSEANENKEVVCKCKEEIEILKQQLEEARTYEVKLIENEAFVDQLNVDLEAARIVETYANNVIEESKNRVEELEMQIEEAKKFERSASESLDLANKSLLEAESENASLEEKVWLMEMTMTKSIESLKSELETAKEEKTRALDNEKLAASSVQALLEERIELVDELEKSRHEIEKSKNAMESLASTIYQVSTEAREAKEKHETYEDKLEDLRSCLKATNEKYETMLGDAKNEIALLTTTIEQSKIEYHNSRIEWEQKELHLMDHFTKSEQEISRLANLVKQYEEQAYASKEEQARLKESLQDVESEVIYMQEAFNEVEIELQSVIQENEELRARERASNNEKDNDLLPKVVELSEENVHGSEVNPKLELPSDQLEKPRKGNSKDDVHQADGAKVDNSNEQQVKEVETKRNEDDSEQQQQQKKNTLLRKFGSLLKKKKKGSNNQK